MKKIQADSTFVNITLVWSVTNRFGTLREQRPVWVCWEFKINQNELGKDSFIYVIIRLWKDRWQYEWKKNGGLFQREGSSSGHFIPSLSESQEDETGEERTRIKEQYWGYAGASGDRFHWGFLRSPCNASSNCPPECRPGGFVSRLLSRQEH